MPQPFIAVIDAWSIGPFHSPVPCTQANSPPDRSTPCSTTWLPPAFTSSFPETCSCGAVPVADTAATATRAEVAVAPALSNACAASRQHPAGKLGQLTVYGLAVAVPSSTGVCEVPGSVEASKNSTLEIDAVGSLAFAVIDAVDPGVNAAPDAGLVMLTDGTCAAPLQA